MSEAAINTGDNQGGWVPGDSFGNRLAQIRQAHGWNWSQAAEACDIERVSWQNWEDGAKPRDYEAKCRAISEATGVSLVWIMTGQTPPDAVVRTGSSATLTLIDGGDDDTPRTHGHLSLVQ